MDSVVKKGIICIEQYGIEFQLCVIEHIIYSEDYFKYVFHPNYSVIELLDSDVFQGIPGLDLDKKKKEYVRKNIIPTFISERVPSANRENLYELLDKVGLTYINPIEYLIRTEDKYSGDDLYVVKYSEKTLVNLDDFLTKNNVQSTIKMILDNLAKGNNIFYNQTTIDDSNRKEVFKLLLGLYLKSLASNKAKQKAGIEEAKKNHKYQGRKAVEVDSMIFRETVMKVENNLLSLNDALLLLNISRDKYYRLKKLLKN